VDAGHAEAKAALAAVEQRLSRLVGIRGKRSPTSFHRELGKIIWDHCGMSRNRAGLEAAIGKVAALRAEFWENLTVTGQPGELNQTLEHAGRVADFLELGEVMCRDALARDESCGCHFREEHVTADGEAKRDDERFAHVAVWEWKGEGQTPVRHQEPLTFENVHLATRSYK
jgi:succinate dehydrogenase / fumarate reductase flavoprotein subunit